MSFRKKSIVSAVNEKVGLLTEYIKDRKHDKKHIQDSEDTNLEAQTKAFIGMFKGGAISADSLKQVMIYMTSWNNNTVESISRCQQEIVDASKGKKIKKKQNELSDLADEYIINISKKMLDLLGELDKFLKSARFYHSYTENVVQEYFERKEAGGVTIDDEHYVNISKKLKFLMDGHRSSSAPDKSATMLLEKVQDLIPLLMDQKCMENLKVKNKQEDLVYHGGENSRYALEELGEVMSLVDKVVNEIESRPCHAINEGWLDLTMKDIKNKLGPILGTIEDLEVEARNCSSKIMETREKIVNTASDYSELTRTRSDEVTEFASSSEEQVAHK